MALSCISELLCKSNINDLSPAEVMKPLLSPVVDTCGITEAATTVYGDQLTVVYM